MSRPAGFTLIELMIVVVLLAILMMIAAPSVRDITLNARMTALANDFMTDLSITRSEAVKRGSRTAMCASNTYAACSAVPPATGAPPGCQCTNTDWKDGWIIFSDSPSGGAYGSINGPDVLIKAVPAIDGASEVQPNTINGNNTPAPTIGPWIGFQASGVVNAGGTGNAITFHLCDSRATPTVAADVAANKGRRITVTNTGRASVAGPTGKCTCDGGADATTKRCPAP